MPILNLEFNELRTDLKELGVSDKNITNLLRYLEMSDELIAQGKDEHWLDSGNYEQYKKLVDGRKSLTTKEIEKFYFIVTKIVLDGKYRNTIPPSTYLHYIAISDAAYESLRTILPLSYAKLKSSSNEYTFVSK